MKKIVLTVFIIFALTLAWCSMKQDSNNEISENSNAENINKVDVNISSINLSVEDAVNYTDAYYHIFKVRLPKVVGNTNTIKELNQKILNEVLPITYCDVASHTILSESLDKGSIYDYKYIIKDDILVINIYSSVPEGGSLIPTSGGGLYSFSYFYDIANDKILTLSELASKLALSLEGLTTLEGASINSYDELEKNHYVITIIGNDLKLELLN